MFKPLIFLLFSCFTCTIFAVDAKIRYYIDIDQPVHHMAKVRIEFPAHRAQELEVRLPVWRTGYYTVLDLSKGVREFSVVNNDGKTIDWSMKDKASWLIQSDGQPVVVSYRIYANDIGRRTRDIDDTHAYLDASAVFMYSPEFRYAPLTVELEVPRGWKSRSGMTSIGRHKFKADNYDIFIDSPIETGIHSFHEFTAGDRDYEILFWGRGNYDEEKIIDGLKKLDTEVAKIWGDFPYSRYVYMVHATNGPRGATEHINSTIIQRQRDRFGSREDFVNFMLTAAHELIHTWNVKAYRPAGLVPYDFQKENYTSLLWVAEGTTSYFDTIITRRAGISNQKEFHKDLAKGIESFLNRPGRKAQSVAEASFYNWIESTNDFTINHSVNIYAKGSLVSWLLDFEIRRATENKRSLEDVHRELYKRFKVSDKGFTDADILSIVNEVTGQDFSGFWDDFIWGTKDIDFETLLDYVGLKLERKASDKQTIDLGIRYDDELKLTRVRKGSPAWNAGLTKDDIILSFDEMRVTQKNMEQKLKDLKPGEPIQVHFFRRDELNQLELKPEKNNNKQLKVVVNPTATPEQKQRYQSWTGFAPEDDTAKQESSDE